MLGELKLIHLMTEAARLYIEGRIPSGAVESEALVDEAVEEGVRHAVDTFGPSVEAHARLVARKLLLPTLSRAAAAS